AAGSADEQERVSEVQLPHVLQVGPGEAASHHFFPRRRAALGKCFRTSLRMRRASATAFRASGNATSGPAPGYRMTVAYAVSRSRRLLSSLGRSLVGINARSPPMSCVLGNGVARKTRSALMCFWLHCWA